MKLASASVYSGRLLWWPGLSQLCPATTAFARRSMHGSDSVASACSPKMQASQSVDAMR